MKRIIFAALVALAPFAAFAQQPPPAQPTPKEQALGDELLDLMSKEANVRAAFVALQRQVDALQAENKRLTDELAKQKPAESR